MVLPLNLDDYGSTLVSFICYASCFCISWILLLVVLIVVPLAMIREKKGNDGQLLEQRHFGGLVGMSPVNPQLASLWALLQFQTGMPSPRLSRDCLNRRSWGSSVFVMFSSLTGCSPCPHKTEAFAQNTRGNWKWTQKSELVRPVRHMTEFGGSIRRGNRRPKLLLVVESDARQSVMIKSFDDCGESFRRTVQYYCNLIEDIFV